MTNMGHCARHGLWDAADKKPCPRCAAEGPTGGNAYAYYDEPCEEWRKLCHEAQIQLMMSGLSADEANKSLLARMMKCASKLIRWERNLAKIAGEE